MDETTVGEDAISGHFDRQEVVYLYSDGGDLQDARKSLGNTSFLKIGSLTPQILR